MKICVIGLGYIGLPTAAMFAAAGAEVVGVDKNPAVIEALTNGEILIEEPGLAELVKETVAAGLLRSSVTPEAADAFIIAVPTPICADKTADMQYVRCATESIVPYLSEGNLVVLESTSPVGTVEELMLPILAQSGLAIGEALYLGHSPERVIPGKILHELVHNSRIAGGINPASAEKIKALYQIFVQGEIFTTSAATAELCKLTENTFRDINIAFANELAKICENLGINVWEAIELCNKHPRVHIHQPGPGVGGHCIAVDPWFIVEKQPETALLIHQARQINDSMPGFVREHILSYLGAVAEPTIAIFGVTYKPDVDDTRESPLLKLIEQLKADGIRIRVHDPHAKGWDLSAEAAVAGADLLLLGVNHAQFHSLDWPALAALMRHPVLYDCRNFCDPAEMAAAGFRYHLLGHE